MTGVLIAEWPKNKGETFRVRLDAYHGCPILDARVWYQDGSGILKPSRAGLTASVRHLPSLAEALTRAAAHWAAANLNARSTLQNE